ncbi:MAG: hydroxymethylbilane synthase [Bacilli bacterium]
MKKIVIGARTSNLALTQAKIVKEELLSKHKNIEIEIIPFTTKGDKRLDINWKTSNESLKGLFTTELENALLENEIDIAVHSLKDMPTKHNEDLKIAGYINQEDERDAFVSAKYHNIEDLPIGAIVGTSSMRRELQLQELRSDLNCRVIRGNIETRINKMLTGEYDAIILAAAGLHRTSNTKYLRSYFEDEEMISASGQGILCLETRSDDFYIQEIIDKIKDDDVTLKAKVERVFSQIFDGGCTTPMGCNAKIIGNRISFKGMYFHNNIRYDGYVEGYKSESEAISYRLSNQIKSQYVKQKGKVYLVGAGPGEYELLTLKAHRLIQNADCILYDRLISNEIIKNINSNCKLIYVGKENHQGGLSQSLINEQIVNAAFDCKTVIRLKSGDPFIFARGFEEIQVLKNYGIDFEIVPGISSFAGASAYSGIPLTDRNHSSDLHIFSGHGKQNEMNLDFHKIANLGGTLIFFMAIRNIKFIVENLIENGKNANTPIAFIENATTSDQHITISYLKEILETDVIARVKAPAIVIIGEVVSLNEKGKWFNMNKQITLLSTREERNFKSFESTCVDYSFKSLCAPQIETVETISEDIKFDNYDIILFNSSNGVKNFVKQFPRCDLNSKIIGSVGIKTKEILESYGANVKILPKVYNMEKLLETTVSLYNSESILVVGSKQTKLDLNKWRRRIHNNLHHCITYDTKMIENDFLILQEQICQSNVLCFFSASGVESFMKNIKCRYELLDAKKIASIGPYTTIALNKYGIDVDIEAIESTQEGLIKSIKEYYIKKQGR